MSTFAVRYTQPLLGAANDAGWLKAFPGVSVQILQDGVECAVYSDNIKTPMDNPLDTGVAEGEPGVDITGNLTVYLAPGRGYSGIATVGARSTTFAIPDISLDFEDSAESADVTAIAEELDAAEAATAALAAATDTALAAKADAAATTTALARRQATVEGLVVNNASAGEVASNTSILQAALDAAEAAVNTVDANTVTDRFATVELPIGYIKVTGVSIASNVRLKGQGDKTILMLAGASNANLIQSKNFGSPTVIDRGIWITDMRLLGNKANQTATLCPQTFVTADTAVSTTPGTIPVLDTTGFDAAGRAWVGLHQVTYTGKTGTSLTGCTIFSGEDTVRQSCWVTPAAGKGHLIALQGTRCHVRVYGNDAIGSGIYFQGPDTLAASGGYGPENVVHSGTRIDTCARYGVEIGEGVPDGMIQDTILGQNNLRGAMVIRSADWMFSNLHLVGTYGSPVNLIPQALLIAANDFRGTGIYFDTWPGTTVVFDTSIRGWTNINDCDLSQLRTFQCSWGIGGGGHGVLYRGIKNHGLVNRPRFAGFNMSSPIGFGYVNAPWTRTVGVQNLTALPSNKVQVRSALDFAPASSVGGPVNVGVDLLEYTGRQMSAAKLAVAASIGATSITVDSTTGFDAAGTITVLAEDNQTYAAMQVTYTGKTATTFTGIPASGAGSVTAAVSAAGERGAVGQHFLTGVSGGTLTSVADASALHCDNQSVLVRAKVVSDPTFRSYQVGRFLMKPGDEWQVSAGTAGDKKMRSTGTLSIAPGASTASAAHGLLEAPTSKSLTATADTQGLRTWVTADSTNITVTTDAPAIGVAITFDWRAEFV